jgi:hypothetical protein
MLVSTETKFETWCRCKPSAMPVALSVQNGRVLICTQPTSMSHELTMCDHTGMKSTIALPANVIPRHAVETGYQTVLVCHSIDAKVGAVSEFTFDGRLICRFELQDCLFRPVYIALGNSGTVFVADFEGNKIKMLCHTPSTEREPAKLKVRPLVIEMENPPERLCLVEVEEAKDLYVTETNSHIFHRIALGSQPWA